jgi:tetratricopeptide (TPR) repeat protein
VRIRPPLARLAALGLLLASGLPWRLSFAAETTIVSLMHRAAEERRKGDYLAAAETYRRVLARAPQLFEAHLFLADTLRKRRLDGEAENELQTARRINPADPLPYAALADMRREKFRFSDALSLLEEGWKLVPPGKREPLIVARGTLLRLAGREGESVDLLRQGAKEFPESARIAEAMARGLESTGSLPEALEAWDTAVRLAPQAASIALARDDARELGARLSRGEEAARKPGAGAGAWGDLARLRLQVRQFAAAAQAAESALRQVPGRTDWMLLRGTALEKAGREEDAERQLQRIGRSSPEHLTSLYHRAFLARRRGDPEGEERIWRDAAERHPRDASAALMLVLNWKRRGILDARIDALRGDAKRGKRRTFSPILEGTAMEEAGRDGEAAGVFEDLFLADPDDPESYARLSGLLSLRPALLTLRLEQELSRHAAPVQDQGPGRHLLLSLLLQAAGRGPAAAEEMREAASLYPDREEVHLGLATILGILGGDPGEISRALDRALELASGSPWAHLEKGLALLRGGDFPGAVREGERVVSLAPELPEGHQLLGVARRQAGDSRGAEEEFGASLLLDPTDSPGVVRFQLALSLSSRGERRAAELAMEEGVPSFPELTYRLAWSFAHRTFLDRSFRGQDWLSWRDRHPGPEASRAEACAAVAEMLSSLGDPYTRLRGEEETATIYLRPRSGKLETDASGAPTPSSASVLSADLEENFGYIRLTNLADPSAREAIRNALDKMALRDGLILDLRGNPGGMASDAEAIAGLLMEPGEELGRERTSFGEQVRGSPQTRPVFTRKPLVILTDRRTGSAAEKLASGLQGAGRATVVGEGTFGKGVSQMSRVLPGGEMVLVTAAENLTREGKPLQWRGVLPDVPEADDVSLEKAKELLRKPPP